MLSDIAFTDGRLLAIDLGLRTGLAAFDGRGSLLALASRHFANRAALKRAAHTLLRRFESLEHVVIEGGGDLAAPWQREAAKRGACVTLVTADQWRRELLPPSARQGPRLKETSTALCRSIIADSSELRPTALRHDAAEAVLAGHYVVRSLGWRV